MTHDGMELIRSQRGLMSQIAAGLKMTRAAVVKWERVPAEYVVAVEGITGIDREKLRPDLYRDEAQPEPPQVAAPASAETAAA